MISSGFVPQLPNLPNGVEGDIGDMPRYDLEDDNSDAMYTHDMLILANVSEPVPDDIIAKPRTYYRDKVIPADSSDSEDEDLIFSIKNDILPLCALCDTLPSHYEHVS
jgi:hypothetical protein